MYHLFITYIFITYWWFLINFDCRCTKDGIIAFQHSGIARLSHSSWQLVFIQNNSYILIFSYIFVKFVNVSLCKLLKSEPTITNAKPIQVLSEEEKKWSLDFCRLRLRMKLPYCLSLLRTNVPIFSAFVCLLIL